MTGRVKTWLLGTAAATAALLIGLVGTGWYLSRRIEPFIRERTVAFLANRFDGEVVLQKLEVSMPVREPLRVLLNKGRGARVTVKASEILLRQHRAREGFPLLKIRSLTFDLDASRLFESPVIVDLVHVAGMEVALPPKGQRMFTPQAKGSRQTP